IVVTFNRLDFLKEIIESLRNQTIALNIIIVVNNSSTDKTSEWLTIQTDLHVINQENIGSSGGQYTGVKTAFELGYDWIWTMDDDVVPANNCLENLMYNDDVNTIRAPLRLTPESKPYFNDAISFNLSNPFRSIWNDILSEKNLEQSLIPAIGITFEGPLFHHSIVEKIGFPEPGFFIYGDDTEYFIRASEINVNIVVVRDAVMKRKLSTSIIQKNYGWKLFYIVRNLIAIDVLHGNCPVRIIRPFLYMIRWLFRVNKFKDIPIIFKAFMKGYFYKVNKNYKIKDQIAK
ncbi:MAG: glycosyltransferase, partial [FCB group bacterium]